MNTPFTKPTQEIVKRILCVQLVCLGLVVGLVILGLFVTNHLGSFPFSFLAGVLGISVSLLNRFRKVTQATPEDLAHLATWSSLLIPLLHGGLMAAIAYLLFMSRLLTGDGAGGLFTCNLFPTFTEPDMTGGKLSVPDILQLRPSSVRDFGKLLVWCFLAGYSEKFVAGILRSLEQRGHGGPPGRVND